MARATIDDDDADMAVGVFAPVPAPVPPPIARAVEIKALHIDEIGPDLLRLRLEVDDIDPAALQREQTLAGIFYEISFLVGPNEYRVYGGLGNTCTNPDDATCENLGAVGVTYDAYLERRNEAARDSVDLGSPPSRVLVDEAAVEVLLPRDLLVGDGHERAAAGTKIDNAWALAQTSHVLFDRWVDEAGTRNDENRTPALTLTQDAYGSHVTVSPHAPDIELEEEEQDFFPQDDPIEPTLARIDVSDTMPARVPLYVTNNLQRKLIVAPEVSILSGGDGYQLRVPDGLELPANDTRRIDVLVNGSAPIDPADPLVLEFTVRPLGFRSDIGDRLAVSVRSVPLLTPDAPRLYLQAGETQAGFWVGPVTWGGSYEGMLSPLATDPDGTSESVPVAINCLCAGTDTWDATAPLGTPALLDPARDGLLHLEIDAPTAADYDIRVTVALDGNVIGTGTLDTTLSAGGNTLDVPLLFASEDPRLDAGGRLALDLRAQLKTLPTPFEITRDEDAPRVRLQGASYIEFPLIDVPVPVQTADHLVVAVGAGYDAYQYVNPGRTTLWNVTIVNQGLENDTVTVSADADQADWTLRVAPGKTFRIGPGESVTVGILATAPEDAAEADHVAVNVTATSKVANGKTATLTVRGIVTGNIQIPDVIYTADNETASRVADVDERGSPGPGAIVAVGIVGLLALGLRRRR